MKSMDISTKKQRSQHPEDREEEQEYILEN